MAFSIGRSLGQHITEAKAEINARATNKITDRYPLGKQASMTALVASGRATADEFKVISDAWAWIKSIVDASNVANSTIDQAVSVADIRAAEQSFKSTLAAL